MASRHTTNFFLIFLSAFSLFPLSILAQNNFHREKKIILKKISFEGNKKTDSTYLNRLLPFHEGDSVFLNDVFLDLKICEDRLLNSNLFFDVQGSLNHFDTTQASFNFVLHERFYTIVLPVLDIYDRNFNSWYVTHNYDWNRLQYGLSFSQNNIGGKGNLLRAYALFGFSQRFALSYNVPFLDKKQQWGLNTLIAFSRNKNITYSSDSNREEILFVPQKFIRRNFRAQTDLVFKPKIQTKQMLSLSYVSVSADDTVRMKNKFYLADSLLNENYFSLAYTFTFDSRNIENYPLSGSLFQFSIAKNGLLKTDNINFWTLGLQTEKYFSLGNKIYFNIKLKGKYISEKNLNYFNTTGLGYHRDYVSGYEYYVCDGNSFALWKNELKKNIFTLHVKVFKNSFLKNGSIPFAFYPKIYFDCGYVFNSENKISNSLNNYFLRGFGGGFDVVSLYDTSMSIEFSVNHLHQSGLYLHFNSFF